MYKRLKLLLPALLLLSISSNALTSGGDIAIVTSYGKSLSTSTDGLRGLFLGRTLVTESGEDLHPVFLVENQVHSAFLRTFLKRSPNQLNSYWAVRIFTGKSSPPVTVNGPEEMLTFLAENENYVGYIDADSVGDKLKVLKLLPAR